MKFKKQILRGLVGCGSLTLPQLPDELVLEILRRLPAKNLIRCKSLSKAWCSTLENPSFMEAYFKDYYTHHRHFGALLVSTVDLRLGMGYPPPILLCFNYSPLIPLRDAELESESELKSKLFWKVLPSPLYIGATKVVNGLVCVYEAKSVMVCNVYTGEIMWLPSIDSDSNSNSTTLNDYYFGYDPVNGVYKLIRVSSSEFRFRGDFSIRKRADIITLSPSSTPSSWRNLDMGHHEPRTFPDESFLFNGVLYWVMHEGLGEPCGLLCLDLNTEEFHFIRPPQQPFFSSANGSPWRIARFMERLALLVPGKEDPPESLVIHTLDNNNCEDGSSVSSSWTRHTVPFPPGFGGSDRFDILPVGNLPTGQILLTKTGLSQDSNSYSKPHYIPVYSYDHSNKKFEKFVAGDLSFNPFCNLPNFPFSISYTLEENNVPLDVLFSSARGER